jgi:transposase IS4-like protein/DDE family transposase
MPVKVDEDQALAISKEVTMSWLSEALDAVQTMAPRGGIERFAASLEPDWIEQALAATGTLSLRRRKFPAEQVVWLVLGMALYADRSIKTVVEHLGLVLEGDRRLAGSAVTKARYRLGAEPIRWLFERVAETWSATPGMGGYRGLGVYGVDGSHLRVQDSDENFEHFGKPGGRAGSGDAGYPQLRFVALMSLSNRLLAAVRAGPFSQSEQALAKEIWAEIPDNSLTILDRGFNSYMSYLELAGAGENRHFLIRLKKDASFEKLKKLPDGSITALIHPSAHALKKDPDVPGPIEVRIISYRHEGGEQSWIATTLLDHAQYPKKELIELYHDRWDVEVGLDELKTHMLERREALRSKKPDGVYQELLSRRLDDAGGLIFAPAI